jgi:hypothetical protein
MIGSTTYETILLRKFIRINLKVFIFSSTLENENKYPRLPFTIADFLNLNYIT